MKFDYFKNLDLPNIMVEKLDGRFMDFDPEKIFNAVFKAFAEVKARSTEEVDEIDVASVVHEVISKVVAFRSEDPTAEFVITVEKMQEFVLDVLKSNKKYKEEYKAYRDYYRKRTKARSRKNPLYSKLAEITFGDLSDSNIKRENGNIDGDSAMGKMLRYGSESAKSFFLDSLIKEDYSYAHREGFIHIHDMDFYGSTTTCTQIDLQDLLSRGFNTGHGYVRPPHSIRTAAYQAAIIIQSNQNDQHGGQSIPNFDLALAKYVKLTFNKTLKHIIEEQLFFNNYDDTAVNTLLNSMFPSEYQYGMSEKEKFIASTTEILEKFGITQVDKIFDSALKKIYRKTYQAMEALLFNLNTMHSRAGAQVPFSSINYGTETSEEGRLVIRCMLEVTEKGLGHGETPIFPVQIFRVMDGVNYNEGDPNYDLYRYAQTVSAKRFFPNWNFQNATFNMQYYRPGHPETLVSTMGCARGDERITVKVDGVVYKNIRIDEAYRMIKEIAEEKENA